ncbi:hypothetical protein A5658_20770 [Mycobacterium sp. 1245111.1]|nr:hypothetical protein A5658_20770 [Mycobacterium sp. 1245111.1]
MVLIDRPPLSPGGIFHSNVYAYCIPIGSAFCNSRQRRFDAALTAKILASGERYDEAGPPTRSQCAKVG